MNQTTHYPPQTRGDGAAESPTVLAARLAGSRAAFAALLADGDAFTRYGGATWMPFRAVTLVAPDGAIQWDSTHLPDTLAGAR